MANNPDFANWSIDAVSAYVHQHIRALLPAYRVIDEMAWKKVIELEESGLHRADPYDAFRHAELHRVIEKISEITFLLESELRRPTWRVSPVPEELEEECVRRFVSGENT